MSAMDREELARMGESLRSAHKRIGALETKVEDLRALTAAVAAVNTKVDTLSGSVDEVKQEVRKVSSRPGIWWDKLLSAALGAAAAGLVAAMLTQILK